MRRNIKLKREYLFAALICALYLLRDVLSISIPSVVFIGVFGLAFLTLGVSDGLGIFMMSLPMTLPNNPIRLVYLLVTGYKLNKIGKLRIPYRVFICVMLLICIQAMDMALLSSESVRGIINNLVEYSVCLIIPVLWFSNAYNPEGKKKAIFMFILAMIVAYSCVLILTVRYRGIDVLFSISSSVRLGLNLGKYITDTGTASTAHPNQIATTAAIGIALLIRMMDEKQLSKVLGWAACCWLFALMIFTKSRTGIICLAIIAAYYYLVIAVRRKQFGKGLGILVIISAIAIASWYLLPDIWQTILLRFTSTDDITNGRVGLSQAYLSIWINDFWCFLFGRGQANYFKISGVYDGAILQSAHNAEVEILMSCGFIGFVLFLYLLLYIYKQNRRGISKAQLAMAVLPVLLNIFIFQGGQYTTMMSYHIRFCFLLVAIGTINQNIMVQDNDG